MRQHLKFIILLALAILILWWFGRKLNWAEVGHSVVETDWRLLAAGVITVSITYLLRAYRWRSNMKSVFS